MASLVTYNDGLRRIDFTLTPNGKRRSVRLGRTNAKAARSIMAKVETIIADKLQSRPHDAEVSQWLASLDETLLSKLRAVGLADGVGVTQTTLGDFLGRYMKTINGKPATFKSYGHTKRNLLDFFNASRLLADITEADADAWRSWLVENQGLAIPTVARRVVAARTFWRKAIRWKLTSSNPFEGIRSGTQQNESRKFFVPADTIQTIIDACSDVQWRLLIGLSRWGGLRCPSEHLALTWADVDWEAGALRVRSIKTEHHDGHAVRTVPMFPELRTLLMDAFEAAEPGAVHVITRYRDATQNLRTQFIRIIRSAGFEPWPRLWQNLRASRESELMREYDLSTVCKWIGNSPAVAAKHYAMSIDRDADFRKAIGRGQAQQKAQQSPSDGHGQGMTCKKGAHEKTPENKGFVHGRQVLSNTDFTGEWAIQGSNL